MGYYMGVFNFFIVIPQIVAAALLGFLVGRFFGGQAIYALAIGGASLVLAAVLTLRVEDKDEPETGTWHPGPLGLIPCHEAPAGTASLAVQLSVSVRSLRGRARCFFHG